MTPGGSGWLNWQAVDDLLPGSSVIDAVLELDAQVRQAEQRLAADVFQARHAGQGDFQRNGDLPFDLLGGGAG